MAKYKTQFEEDSAKILRDKYHGVHGNDYESDLSRLRQGEPVEYIIGWSDFLSCHIDLSLRPMIPRPETAFWVDRAIHELSKISKPLRIADTFAGAGNVAVAILTKLPNASVDISEIDPNLKQQIEINIERNHIDVNRVRVISGDALSGLHGTYDAIFAVPPYVPDSSLTELDPEMINFEPHLAFFGGPDGHKFHRILIEQAWNLLNKDGVLFMEADIDHGPAISKMVEGTQWSKLEFWNDPYGATPNVVLRK